MVTAKAKTTKKAPVKKEAVKKEKVIKPIAVKKHEVEVEKTPEIIEESVVTNGKEKYFESVGRRKSSVARVRLLTKKSSDEEPAEGRSLVQVNSKSYLDYFKDTELQAIVDAPFKKLKSMTRFKVTALVNGGGANGQAEAVRHGISRALTMFDENFSKKLKKAGYLTRDPREKERRKPGLKKARKSPRWSKR